MRIVSGNPLDLDRYYESSEILSKIIPGLDIKPGVIGLSIKDYTNLCTVDSYTLSEYLVKDLELGYNYFISNPMSPTDVTVGEVSIWNDSAKTLQSVMIIIYVDMVPIELIKEHDIFIHLDPDCLKTKEGSTIYINSGK